MHIVVYDVLIPSIENAIDHNAFQFQDDAR